jgi:tRNA (guanine6-N2)-methyltransferase
LLTIIARSVHGLEWVSAEEIAGRLQSALPPTLARRAVTVRVPALHRGLLALRTVDDVFLEVGRIDDVGTTRDVPPALAKRLAHLNWDASLAALRTVRPVPPRPRFDVVASLEGRRSFNRFAVENAVGAVLASRLPGTYLERTSAGRQSGEPDVTVRLLVRGSTAVAALRLGTHPLHRRPYKVDTGPGTLHPPAAAALARLVNPTGAGLLLDPFCGDGTIAIEAASAYPRARVVASDIDPARLANAEANARRAAVEVALSAADAARVVVPGDGADAVVTNPPWDVAVDARGDLTGSLDRFWERLPTLLTGPGRVCLVTDEALDVPATLRSRGFRLGLQAKIRLAGRVSDLVLGTSPAGDAPVLDDGLAGWRRRAIAAGVVTGHGF